MNNVESKKYRDRAFGFKLMQKVRRDSDFVKHRTSLGKYVGHVTSIFHFVAKNKEQRDAILLTILNRLPANKINQSHLQTIRSMQSVQTWSHSLRNQSQIVLEIDHSDASVELYQSVDTAQDTEGSDAITEAISETESTSNDSNDSNQTTSSSSENSSASTSASDTVSDSVSDSESVGAVRAEPIHRQLHALLARQPRPATLHKAAARKRSVRKRSVRKDRKLNAEKKRLEQDRKQLNAERKQMKKERKELLHSHESIREASAVLQTERVELQNERQRLAVERRTLARKARKGRFAA